MGFASSLSTYTNRMLRLNNMGPAEIQRLQQKVDQPTTFVTQMMEGHASRVTLPASPPGTSVPVPVAMAERYEGNPDHCQAFLMQCGLYIKEHLERFFGGNGMSTVCHLLPHLLST